MMGVLSYVGVILSNQDSIAYRIRSILGNNVSDDLVRGAVALAAFFFIYILVQVSLKLFSGQEFPWTDILRPILLILAISQWSLVVSTMDSVGQFMGEKLDAAFEFSAAGTRVAEQVSEAQDVVAKVEQNVDDAGLEAGPDDSKNEESNFNGFRGILDRLTKGVKVYFLNSLNNMTSPLDFLAGLLYYIVGSVMMVLSQMYLLLLTAIGPFVLAFCIIPQFNSIWRFVGTYIQYWLWVPAIKLVRGMIDLVSANLPGTELFGILSYVATGQSNATMAPFEALDGQINSFADAMGYLEFVSILRIAGIFLMFSIPKICSLLVQSGSDLLSGNLGQAASRGASMAASAATGVPVK